MKQNITPEQLSELSEEGIKRYVNWCTENNLINSRISKSKMSLGASYSFEYPLLSVGQMIEFLEEHGVVHIGKIPSNNKSKSSVWEVSAMCWHKESSELCDALWEAVKEILAK